MREVVSAPISMLGHAMKDGLRRTNSAVHKIGDLIDMGRTVTTQEGLAGAGRIPGTFGSGGGIYDLMASRGHAAKNNLLDELHSIKTDAQLSGPKQPGEFKDIRLTGSPIYRGPDPLRGTQGRRRIPAAPGPVGGKMSANAAANQASTTSPVAAAVAAAPTPTVSANRGMDAMWGAATVGGGAMVGGTTSWASGGSFGQGALAGAAIGGGMFVGGHSLMGMGKSIDSMAAGHSKDAASAVFNGVTSSSNFVRGAAIAGGAALGGVAFGGNRNRGTGFNANRGNRINH